MTPSTPTPAGFPGCRHCALYATGTATICFVCANGTLYHEPEPRCPTCGLHQPGATCANPICNFDDRGFGQVHVIAGHTGALREAISRFKHGHGDPIKYATAWARIFGRLIVGYLDAHAFDLFGAYDLIVPNPTYPQPGRPRPTEMTIDAARDEASKYDWPFDERPWALTKAYATPRSTSGRWRAKYDAAVAHAAALEVDVSKVDGKRILIYDDVFTTGSQYHLMGNLLRDFGASGVDGLVLARRSWSS